MAQYHDYDADLVDDGHEYVEPRVVNVWDARFLVPLGLFLCAILVIALAMRADSRRESATTGAPLTSASNVDGADTSVAEAVAAAELRAGYDVLVYQATNGVIVLQGNVANASDAIAAGAVARSVIGVQNIDNQLLVLNDPSAATALVETVDSVESTATQIQQIEGITFEPGSAVITAESVAVLERAARILQSSPSMRVEVHGHTDTDGSAATNETLSQLRASAVIADLSSRGIDSRRMTPVGFGESDPIAPNITEEGRAKNRRIEFVVLYE